jgi:hypothetical protein
MKQACRLSKHRGKRGEFPLWKTGQNVTGFPTFLWKIRTFLRKLKGFAAAEKRQKFQTGYKQEKIYHEIVKKLLQFVKDRVTLYLHRRWTELQAFCLRCILL